MPPSDNPFALPDRSQRGDLDKPLQSSSINPYAPTVDVTNERPIDAEAELAGLWQRFFGSLIDNFVQLALLIPIGFGIGFASVLWLDPSWKMQILSSVFSWLAGVIIFLLLHGYLLAKHGKTIGKLALNTRIVDRQTNQIPPFWPLIGKRYLWYWIATSIPILNILVILVNALLIFRDNRACLHDDIAGTKVIRE